MAREKGKAYGFSFPDDSWLQGVSGPNDGFLLNTLITNFRLSRVFLDVWSQVAQAHYESPEQHYPT